MISDAFSVMWRDTDIRFKNYQDQFLFEQFLNPTVENIPFIAMGFDLGSFGDWIQSFIDISIKTTKKRRDVARFALSDEDKYDVKYNPWISSSEWSSCFLWNSPKTVSKSVHFNEYLTKTTSERLLIRETTNVR